MIRLISSTLCVGVLAVGAEATPIELTASGQNIDGQIVTLNVVYDTIAAGTVPDPSTEGFDVFRAIESVSIAIDGMVMLDEDGLFGSPLHQIAITNDDPGDALVITSLFSGLPVSTWQLMLTDDNANVFSDFSLPDSIQLADFDDAHMIIAADGIDETVFTITSLETRILPAPSGLACLGLGALSLRRRRRGTSEALS